MRNKRSIIQEQFKTSSDIDVLFRSVLDMGDIDLEESISMWYELLCRFKSQLTNRKYVGKLIKDFYLYIDKQHGQYGDYYTLSRNINKYIIPAFRKHKDLINIIYGHAKCGGVYYGHNYTPFCLACLIIENNADLVYKAIECLSNNTHMIDYKEKYYDYYGCSVGEFLNRTHSEFCNIVDDYSFNDTPINIIGNEVKDALIASLNLIKDDTDRAECTIPIMSIVGYKYK
jgi:hypothetical protein